MKNPGEGVSANRDNMSFSYSILTRSQRREITSLQSSPTRQTNQRHKTPLLGKMGILNYWQLR